MARPALSFRLGRPLALAGGQSWMVASMVSLRAGETFSDVERPIGMYDKSEKISAADPA